MSVSSLVTGVWQILYILLIRFYLALPEIRLLAYGIFKERNHAGYLGKGIFPFSPTPREKPVLQRAVPAA